VRAPVLSLLVLASLAGCSKKHAEKPAPAASATVESATLAAPSSSTSSEEAKTLTGTVTLGDSGVTVTVPDGFGITPSKVTGFWNVEGVWEYVGPLPHKGTVASLMSWSGKMSTKQEAIKSLCKGGTAIVLEPIADGGFIVSCKHKMGVMGTKVETETVRAYIPARDGGSIECYYEADKPKLIEVTKKICRSLKAAEAKAKRPDAATAP